MANNEHSAVLGLGFHNFEGNPSVKDVIHEIGADFNVREDRLVRLPQDKLDALLRGERIDFDEKYVIETHKATVHDGLDKTIGVVGSDYGVIQNTAAFDILDMMCNASVTETPLQIVSAGLVHESFDPYMQALLPSTAKINGDKSETKFYAFVHTSHDGTSGLQVRFSPIRVICQNTFLANVSSKIGITVKHSKNAPSRVDLTKECNVQRIKELVANLNALPQEYVDQMNAFALAKVDDKQIEEYVMNLFVKDDKEGMELKRNIREHDYNLSLVDDISTRTLNMINDFKDTLYSDADGQDFATGTKLWLFNGTTKYLTHKASYGSMNDDEATRATKRFDSMLNGTANKRMEKAMEMLVA